MTSTTSSWDSLAGRRGVDIGASFTRAWNERIGKTVKRSKDYPNPEYYSLRYNFKPESIDNENTGTLTPKPGGNDGRIFELERPSLQHGDSHKFTMVEQPSKEWECVLLWDPVLQQLTLEKLESTFNLHHEGRSGTKGRPPSTTPPSLPGSSHAASTSQGKSTTLSPQTALAEDLERVLTGGPDADAEGEPDDELEFQAELDAAAAAYMKQEEEEDEEDMEAVDVAAPLPPAPPPPLAKTKAAPKARPTGGKGRPRSNTKRDRVDIEEEVLVFGEPTRKRSRRVSATHASNGNNLGLALPTAPQPTQSHAAPTPSELLQPPSRITYAGSDSDDSDDGGQELGEELDAAALELELEQTLAEAEADEDEGMEAVPSEIDRQGRPLTLNELLGGQSSNDDDTTSDDSDDD